MKLVSWNVNGIKSIMDKGKDGVKGAGDNHVLKTLVDEEMPDIICLQEIRCSPQVTMLESFAKSHGYEYVFMNCSKSKKGYSGTAVLSKLKPKGECVYDFGDFNIDEEMNNEGRIITVEYDKFVLVTVYTPNSKQELERLEYRTTQWEPTFRGWVSHLQETTGKGIVVCGDLNVAHQDIDLKNPQANRNHAGFTLQERAQFVALLKECGMLDTFRTIHPNLLKYSWWSNFAKSRDRNVGWRIDYVLSSKKFKSKIVKADILVDFKGSDHAPVMLEMVF
jgi:exodeoxyribonuclease III